MTPTPYTGWMANLTRDQMRDIEPEAPTRAPVRPNPNTRIVNRYGTVLRIYDAGAEYADRYTVIPPRWAHQYRESPHLWGCITSNNEPFHPQGWGQHDTAMIGPHLGKRIKWADLPADVQRFARQSFPEYAPKEST